MSDAQQPRVRSTEHFPLVQLGFGFDLAFAIAATLLAAWLRFLVDDQLPPGFPFLTFFPVVLAASFLLGTRAGIISAILSAAASWYWFLPPFESFRLGLDNVVALALYIFITATQVALVYWLQRANRRAVAAREANARLAETRELLFRELQHRVSNNLQMIAALLTVQRRRLTDESARAALDEAARRLDTVGKISRQLYDPSGGGQQLGRFLDQLARDVIQSSTPYDIKHQVSGEPEARISPDAAIPLALVVAESIANAIEHGFTEGQSDCWLDIRLVSTADQRLAVEIEDNGRGLPDGFNLQSSTSLGLKIATMLASQLGGTYTLAPGAAGGARARLELPLLPA